jgi:hypothetical protein
MKAPASAPDDTPIASAVDHMIPVGGARSHVASDHLVNPSRDPRVHTGIGHDILSRHQARASVL